MSRKKSYFRINFISEYQALKNAVHRCHNENHASFSRYGGRGITVCEAWKGEYGFFAFLDHIGPRPSPAHSLDRIDNDKGYYPGNVRWTDRKTQQNNRRPIQVRVNDFGWGIGFTKGEAKQGKGPRQSPLVPLAGRVQTLAEWAKELDMCPATIRQRLQRGLSPEQALNPNTSRKGESRNARPTIH